MKEITFGTIKSYTDLNLILSPGKEIGSPAVKRKVVDIEGADSSIDYTDYFGEPKYENMTHKLPFGLLVPHEEFLSQFSKVKNALHGKKMRIIMDDDKSFYYVGRLSVSPGTWDNGVGRLTVECDCEPYKYKLDKTVVSKAVNGTATIVITNGRKRAVPEVTIQTDTSLNIVYQTYNVWDLGSGSFTLPELELVEGANTVTVTGTGNITFTWQEASL